MEKYNLKKIVLIVPPVKSGKSFVGKSLPPFGLVRIATVIRKSFPDLEIKILDGVVLGQKYLENYVKNLPKDSILGLSAHTSLNWSNCLELIKKSATKNIVIGGIHAYKNHCGRLIVENHHIDVIHGQGEASIVDYIKYHLGEKSKDKVRNLIYFDSKSNELKENQMHKFDQTQFPFPDYKSFLSSDELNNYAKNFKKLFLTGDIGFIMISPEGCKWQGMGMKDKSYCLFCDIGTQFKRHSPKFFAETIKYHVKEYGSYGKVFMVDYADEATGIGINWWKKAQEEILKTGLKPHKDYAVKIYAKSGKGFLDSFELGKVLWDIGVEDIHVGFEAATNKDLNSLQKGSSLQDYEKFVGIVKENNFRLIAAFVLGAPTTTKNSLKECVKLSNKMKKKLGDKLSVVAGSLLMPLLGSPAWELLKEKSKEKSQHTNLFFGNDNPDLILARRLWYEWFCKDLVKECGGVENVIKYAKSIGHELSQIGSLPTPENKYG